MDPRPPDIAPKAMIREAMPAKPKVGSAESLARRVATRVDQSNYREGLDIARKFPPDTQRRVARTEQFYSESRTGTGAKDRKGAEKKRFDDANIAAVLVEQFMEVGYDKMGTDQAALRDAVIDVARSRPALARELDTIKDPNKVKAFAERILKDPKLMAEVRNKYDILTDPDNTEILVDAVSPLKQKVDQLQAEYDAKEVEVSKADAQLTEVNTQLEEYDRSTASLTGKKKKWQELDELKRDYPKIKTEVELYTQRVNVADTEYRRLLRQSREYSDLNRSDMGGVTRSELEDRIAQAKQALDDATKEMGNRNARILKMGQLEEEELSLRQNQRRIEQDKTQKDLELKTKDIELTGAKGELSDAKRIRASQEQDITSGFQNIVKEATNEVFNQEAESYYQATEEELEEAGAKATPDENALFQGMQQAWRKEITTGKWFWQTKRLVADGAKVDKDFRLIMGKGGPKEVMTNILKTMDNPGTGAKYTDEDISKLLSNEEFVGKMQPMLVRTLLRHRIHTGGLTHEDIDNIVDAPWGEGMIQEALNRNAQFRQDVAGVYGEGALKGHGPIDKLKAEFKKHPASFIALLLGLGIPGLLIGGTIGAGILGGMIPFLGPTGAILGGAGGAGAGAAVAGGSKLGTSPETETPIAA